MNIEIDRSALFVRFSDDTKAVLEMLDALPLPESFHESLFVLASKTRLSSPHTRDDADCVVTRSIRASVPLNDLLSAVRVESELRPRF